MSAPNATPQTVQVVIDYEARPDGTEGVVLRGVFAAGDPLPPELAAHPPAGTVRNVATCHVGFAVGGRLFRVRTRGAVVQPAGGAYAG